MQEDGEEEAHWAPRHNAISAAPDPPDDLSASQWRDWRASSSVPLPLAATPGHLQRRGDLRTTTLDHLPRGGYLIGSSNFMTGLVLHIGCADAPVFTPADGGRALHCHPRRSVQRRFISASAADFSTAMAPSRCWPPLLSAGHCIPAPPPVGARSTRCPSGLAEALTLSAAASISVAAYPWPMNERRQTFRHAGVVV